MKSLEMVFKNNIRSLSSYEGANIFRTQRWGYFLVAAILAALCAVTTYRMFNVPQYYSELIVGNIAWNFSNKLRDYVVLFTLVGGFFFFIIALSLLSKRLVDKVGPDAEYRFHDFLILLSSPAGVWFAGLLVTQNDSLSLLLFSGDLLVLGVVFVFLLTRKGRSFWQNDVAQFFRVLHTSFLAILASGFAAVAISIGANRIAALLFIEYFIDNSYTYRFTLIAPLVFVILVICFIFTSRSPNDLELVLRRSILLLQTVLPAFFLLLVPTPWLMENSRLVIGYSLSILAWVMIILCIIATYIDLYRRYNLCRSTPIKNPVNLFSLFCIIGVLLYLKATPVNGPSISSDDYHFGEMLVPWWSMVHQHMVPFWDYSPARGLMNYFQGAATSMLFDGKVSSFNAVLPFLYLGLLFVSLPVLKRSVGLGVAALALLFAPYINGISEIDILVTVFICVLCQGFLRWNPSLWILIWFALGISIILYAPGQGALAIFATAPLGLFMFYRAYIEERKKLLKTMFVFLSLTIVLCLFTPFGKMIFGAIRYGLEQSAVNSIANGISWNASFGKTNANPWLFEIMRASWLLVTIWAGVLILKMRYKNFAAMRSAVLTYAVPIFLLTIFFIIRAAGRIDAGPSRLGIASIWALSLLLPLLLFAVARVKRYGNTIFIWLSIAGFLVPFYGGIYTNYPYVFDPVPNPTFTDGFVSGPLQDLPELGSAVMDPVHLDRITAIRKVLDKVLAPQETYLDLTGRHAHYFYVNRRPPIETGSIYNLVTEAQQLRAIESLRKQPPPVVLLSADNILHDGGPVSLRSNLLYRHVMLMHGYKVVEIGGQVWLVRSDRIERVSGMDIKSVSEMNDSPSNSVHKVFRNTNLQSIPASWGASYTKLESKMRQVVEIPNNAQPIMNSVVKTSNGNFRVMGNDPYIRFNVSELNLRGRDAGVMSFDFTCKDMEPFPIIELYWSSLSNPESELTVIRINGRNGHLIVPMDVEPAWLLAENITSIRFDVSDKKSCSAFQIENIKLFQRHGVK